LSRKNEEITITIKAQLEKEDFFGARKVAIRNALVHEIFWYTKLIKALGTSKSWCQRTAVAVYLLAVYHKNIKISKTSDHTLTQWALFLFTVSGVAGY
jgi:hypothetical protein